VSVSIVISIAELLDLIIRKTLKYFESNFSEAPYLFHTYKLIALSHFQLEAEEALVFEDSPSGIKAAIAAQITTIGVATSLDEGLLHFFIS
jgi:phosphoglycolate phosphatase-like HAD superfamily hydrolase